MRRRPEIRARSAPDWGRRLATSSGRTTCRPDPAGAARTAEDLQVQPDLPCDVQRGMAQREIRAERRVHGAQPRQQVEAQSNEANRREDRWNGEAERHAQAEADTAQGKRDREWGDALLHGRIDAKEAALA